MELLETLSKLARGFYISRLTPNDATNCLHGTAKCKANKHRELMFSLDYKTGVLDVFYTVKDVNEVGLRPEDRDISWVAESMEFCGIDNFTLDMGLLS